jgi:CHASE2 domain-containing sensor protein
MLRWLTKVKQIVLCGLPRDKFLTSVLIGLAVTLLLHYFPVFRQLEDVAMDFMIGVFQGIIKETNDFPPLILLDIDEESYKQWKYPLFTPRDKLLTLIKRAVENQAKIIIVDVNLSSQLSDKPSPNTESDNNLFNYLKDYSSHCNDRCPQILLLRTLDYPTQENYPWQERASFLDEAVKISQNDIHWASNLFTLKNDFIVRQQRFWEAVCTPEGTDNYIIPSFSLWTIALLKEESKSWEDLRLHLYQYLDPFRPQNCHQPYHFPTSINQKTLSLGYGKNKRTIHLESSDKLPQRIIYKFPWKLSETKRPEIKWQEKLVKSLTLIPAHSIAESPKPKLLFPGEVKDSIVIIGGSFRESRDLYMTPLGEMPGSFIIANMIYSLWQSDIKSPSLGLTLVIELGLIWITIFLFTRLDILLLKISSVVKTRLIMVILFISLLFSIPLFLSLGVGIMSFYWFQQGVWINFLFPLVGVILHHWGEIYLEYLQSKCHRSE